MPTTSGGHNVNTVSVFLTPLSWLYGAGVRVRNMMFDAGIRRIEDAGVPVISVGNLTAGGTGKTPFVAMIVSRLMKEGKSVAIVSRGYGRSTNGPVIVSDGSGPMVGPEEGGDEPVELARKLPGAIVAVDERRVRVSRMIVERWSPDVIVMDDGFQHRMLKRNFDCVLIDAANDIAADRLLPAGRMREPIDSLRRADMVVLTRYREGCTGGTIRGYFKGPIGTCRPALSYIRDRKTGETIPAGSLRGVRCTAFCGIGSPESFRETLEETGATCADMIRFPDHHRYSESDLESVVDRARSNGSKMILTTEKDDARFPAGADGMFPDDCRVCTVGISIVMIEGEDELWSGIRRATGG